MNVFIVGNIFFFVFDEQSKTVPTKLCDMKRTFLPRRRTEVEAYEDEDKSSAAVQVSFFSEEGFSHVVVVYDVFSML